VLRDSSPTPGAGEGYAQVLEHVRQELRARRFDLAERELMKAGTITGEDPAFLNLAGVLHESHGRIESARKFYQRAVAKDNRCRPALENLARLDELRGTGRPTRPVAFGDGDSRGSDHAGASLRLGIPCKITGDTE
jgi:hypothetical protein